MKWQEMTFEHRFQELCRKTSELLNGLTRYERDCMMSVHLAEMHRQPVDQVAKRVIEEAVDRFNEAWRQERESATDG
jgi:hypothetical protein